MLLSVNPHVESFFCTFTLSYPSDHLEIYVNKSRSWDFSSFEYLRDIVIATAIGAHTLIKEPRGRLLKGFLMCQLLH